MPPPRAAPAGHGVRRTVLGALAGLAVVALVWWQAWPEPVRVGPGPAVLDPDASPPSLAPAPAPDAPRPQAVSAPAEPLTRATGFFGRVEDLAGAPIPGARVRVLAAAIPAVVEGPPMPVDGAASTTDADGRFLVGPAPASGAWLTLEARASGRATARRRVAARGTNVVLVMAEAASLLVSVRDPQRAPIAGARILAFAGNSEEEAFTDADGDARFEGLAPGPVELHVSAAGRGPVRSSAALARPGDLARKTVVLSPGAPLEVRVVQAPSDVATAGVRVVVENRTSGVIQEEVGRTDASGRLAVPGAGRRGDDLLLWARQDGGDEATAAVTLTGDAPVATVLLRLPPAAGVELAGEVADLAGRPVGGATVMFANMGALWSTGRTATSDAAGRFVLRAPADRSPDSTWRVGALTSAQGIAIAAVRPGTPGRLALLGAGRVEGTISDGKGTRLEGAWIVLEPDGPRDPELGTLLLDLRVRTLRTAVSDASGAWACPGVPTGAYRVSASWGEDYAADLGAVSVVAEGAQRRDLRLETGLSLEGQVISTGGAGLVGASVTAWPEQGVMPYDVRPRTLADAQGRFTLRGVSPGRWTVEASAPGHVTGQDPSVLVPSQRAVVRLTELGSMRGVVEDPDGAPYAEAFEVRVTAAEAARPGAADDEVDDGTPRTFSTGDGTFRLAGLPAGPHRVDVRTPSGLRIERPIVVVVQDGEEAPPLRLRLRRGATIHGTLRGADDGHPLAGASVEVLLGDYSAEGTPDARFTAIPDADGRWSVTGLGIGTWRVIARAPRGRFAEARLPIEWGQDVECPLEAPGTGRLVLRVKDAQGEPVAGAKVILESERGTPLLEGSAGRTDAAGRWSSAEVPAGHVRLRVGEGPERGTSDDQTVDVPAGGEVTVDSLFRRKVGPR